MTEPRRGVDIETEQTRSGRSTPDTRPSIPPRRLDVSLALLVFVASIVNVASQDGVGVSEVPIIGMLLLALSSLAVLWRRVYPPAVLGVALAMMAVWMLLEYPGNPVFHMLVSLYAIGRYVDDPKIGLAMTVVALSVVGVGQGSDGDSLSEVAIGLGLAVLAWYVGRRVRARGLHAVAARERAEHLEWRRRTEAQRAIADARDAIARELHDVVAHNVSVMTVQAGVARLLVNDDPRRAQEAIGAVEEAGRSALDELRQLLGVLRPDAASGDLHPQPALNQIPELIDRLRQTGMEVSVSADVPSELPVRVELFAYRIIQEALTNVLKHGGVDAVTRVRVELKDGHLLIEVTDNGAGTSALPGAGRGIAGMRERAVLLGGTLEAGAKPEGGFRVFAQLPIGDQ